ncbi:response regulator transcription factor [Alkalibacter rhizosphaerae]|uniref:Stage 0 sporulation protein A homolog n=1 Tax=Alkalibacter rhizosphaerae TaxID=2815577 RepID=A0A974XDT5_9FIRM|nr:response regulator transcription factor [Alkalibacter rhizosphaerae]QSX07821.1 response regulator transcription factor [Alkalibacter rhizosphaerae]
MNEKILVVDDERSINDLIRLDLEFEGYVVESAFDGQEALDKVESFHPDLIVLDVMLPKINGFDVCKRVNADKSIPIILLTAKTDVIDRVLGLELGADDYLTKPFDNRELLARVKALLRRSQVVIKEERDVLENNEIVVTLSERKVLIKGDEIHLTPKEYELLLLLISSPEQVFSREVLLEKVWGYDYFGDTRTVDMHIQRIRKKIADHSDHEYIQTIFGVGYKMRKF